MDRFAEIRPYNDDEVRGVLDNLVANDEFIKTLAKLRFSKLDGYLPWLFRPLIRRALNKEIATISDVRSFQAHVTVYVKRILHDTTKSFSVSHLERLEHGKTYLFMSNHRDITLDPTLVNYALFMDGHNTARIAIGDNLLSKSFVADLMRLNKCFIVNRSAKGPRQALSAYKTLSAYIHHSLKEDKIPVWIAQREGRAKDGNDRTEPAIIKMLAISRDRKMESFSEYINGLNIVPVSISYEYDPCDGVKAGELYQKTEHGKYEKSEYEDLKSIGLGISGQKGDVQMCFGMPLEGDFDTPEAVAAAVDKQVIENYVLHPSNFFAYQQLYGSIPDLNLGGGKFRPDSKRYKNRRQHFEKRINALPPAYREYALSIYANPVLNKLRITSTHF